MHDADSEHSFRKLLDEHLPATTSPAIATAIMAYNNNIAQQGLITIFNLSGPKHSLTKQYRKTMQNILE